MDNDFVMNAGDVSSVLGFVSSTLLLWWIQRNP